MLFKGYVMVVSQVIWWKLAKSYFESSVWTFFLASHAWRILQIRSKL